LAESLRVPINGSAAVRSSSLMAQKAHIRLPAIRFLKSSPGTRIQPLQ